MSEPGPAVLSILNAMPEPAIVLSRDYEILLANDAYRAAYGFSDRRKAQRCFEVSHRYSVPCDQAGETCPLQHSLASGQPTEVLHVHHTPRGEEYVNVEMWPIRDPQTDAVEYFIERMHPAAIDTGATEQLVGRSASFQAMLQLVQRVAGSATSVMLLGESGTGKELVAQAIHRASKIADGPFVPVECTGLPEGLFESELFGYVKGAFTGADVARPGLVESASGGTLFLDEVGDIGLPEQVKLLRLLESRRFRRVGSVEWQAADFRLVCATNKNLKQLVSEGRFREDLYYRLCVFEIELPPLRERLEDLELLIETLLERLGKAQIGFSAAALRCLRQYDFPGNIRELRNIVERAALLIDGDTVEPQHLPSQCQHSADRAGPQAVAVADLDAGASLADVERAHLLRAMAAHHGDRSALAKKLGISERALYRKLAALKV
ncbi:MAG: sigma-54 interaction domain-containing protein [Pseudomonadales bacterium]